MAVRRSGHGPDVVLFHGGLGSWKHWTRNIGPLAERFTVHALDHPSYGASATVPRETSGADDLDLVHRLFVEMFPGSAPLLTCKIRLLWGERDDSKFRPADLESAPEVNRLMLEFFAS